MRTYTTSSGDQWDIIAKAVYGDEMKLDVLMPIRCCAEYTNLTPGRWCRCLTFRLRNWQKCPRGGHDGRNKRKESMG